MKISCPRIARWAVLAVLLSLLAACATGPRIRTDFDPEADFSRYRTYAFYQPIGMESLGYSTYYSDRIKAGVRREMEARGYSYEESSPDLLVNFQGSTEERYDVDSSMMWGYPWYDLNYGYNYYGRGYYGSMYGYDPLHVRRYTEGTISFDLVEARRKRLVWTGNAVDTVRDGTPQDRAARMDGAITQIFLQYPYRAGSGQPVPAN